LFKKKKKKKKIMVRKSIDFKSAYQFKKINFCGFLKPNVSFPQFL